MFVFNHHEGNKNLSLSVILSKAKNPRLFLMLCFCFFSFWQFHSPYFLTITSEIGFILHRNVEVAVKTICLYRIDRLCVKLVGVWLCFAFRCGVLSWIRGFFVFRLFQNSPASTCNNDEQD